MVAQTRVDKNNFFVKIYSKHVFKQSSELILFSDSLNMSATYSEQPIIYVPWPTKTTFTLER